MLELNKKQLSDLMQSVLQRVSVHLETLDEQPASVDDPARGAELARKLREPAPESATSAEAILELLLLPFN